MLDILIKILFVIYIGVVIWALYTVFSNWGDDD